MADNPPAPRDTRNLVTGIDLPRYMFVEHVQPGGSCSGFRHHEHDDRTLLVLSGQLEVDYTADGERHSLTIGELDGWHAPAGAYYRWRTLSDEPVVLVEAGTNRGALVEASIPRPPVSTPRCSRVSDYQVSKPWGHEIWYTSNLREAPYAVKQIYMRAGNQSSLQSHQQKTETNYVIDGEATVINGLPAPADTGKSIDLSALPRQKHQPRSGWSSAPGILHRVIAESDYTSIEVSTPELDDVIRWADDTGRGNGRIDAEHVGGGR